MCLIYHIGYNLDFPFLKKKELELSSTTLYIYFMWIKNANSYFSSPLATLTQNFNIANFMLREEVLERKRVCGGVRVLVLKGVG